MCSVIKIIIVAFLVQITCASVSPVSPTAPLSPPPPPPFVTGEQACEGHGYSQAQCEGVHGWGTPSVYDVTEKTRLPCCIWHDSDCWSAIARRRCHSYAPPNDLNNSYVGNAGSSLSQFFSRARNCSALVRASSILHASLPILQAVAICVANVLLVASILEAAKRASAAETRAVEEARELASSITGEFNVASGAARAWASAAAQAWDESKNPGASAGARSAAAAAARAAARAYAVAGSLSHATTNKFALKAKVQWLPKLRRLAWGYIDALRERPLLTNAVTAETLACVGDIICQKGLEKQEHFDWRRNAAITTWGCFYSGVVCYYIAKFYVLILPAWCKMTPIRQGICCSALSNFLAGPWIHIPIFYIIFNGILQGGGIIKAWENLEGKWWSQLGSGWSLWVPVGVANYGFVPAHLRVVVTNVANFVWSIIIDYMAHK